MVGSGLNGRLSPGDLATQSRWQLPSPSQSNARRLADHYYY